MGEYKDGVGALYTCKMENTYLPSLLIQELLWESVTIMCVSTLWKIQIRNQIQEIFVWGNEWQDCSQFHSTGLMKETDLFNNNCLYLLNKYLTLCHLLYALPHCRLRGMLEIGIDVISVYRWGNQGLERWRHLLSVTGPVNGGAMITPSCVFTDPTPRCLSGDRYLPGKI